MMYRLFVVVEIGTEAGVAVQTDTLQFDYAADANRAYDNLMATHTASPVTRYEVTKLY